MACRKCGSDIYRMSHRRPLEKVVNWVLPVRPYRCGNCRRRFWGLDWPLFPWRRIAAILIAIALFVVYGLPWVKRGGRFLKRVLSPAAIALVMTHDGIESSLLEPLDPPPTRRPVAADRA